MRGGADEGTRGGEGEDAAIEHARAKVPICRDDPRWGSPLAPVTLVEYADLQCRFSRLAQKSVLDLKARYGPETIRVVFKHCYLPFHRMAGPAAEAAAAVRAVGGDEAFFRFVEIALQEQRSLNHDNFALWALQAGAPKEAFQDAYDGGTFAAKVEHDHSEASSLGVRGTPTFYVNGIKLSGEQPTEVFERVIDTQLKRAHELRASGLPESDVYRTLTDANFRDVSTISSLPRPPSAIAANDNRVAHIPVGKRDPARGAETPLVTLVELGDFQCPFGKSVQPTIERLLKEFEGDLRHVWQHRPLHFHNEASAAAMLTQFALETGGTAAFWKAHGALFEEQARLTEGEAVFQEITEKTGLNWALAKKAILSGKYQARISHGGTLAEKVSAKTSPYFFINGRRVAGAQPASVFKAVVEQELGKARALEAAGVPRSKIYRTLMASAKNSAPERTVRFPEKLLGAAPRECPFLGAKHAPVVVQVFGDFECGHSARMETTLQCLKKQYGKRLKIVWRHLPLPHHANAQLSAEASLEALAQLGNAGFWKYHSLLFANQRREGGLCRGALEECAARIGLNAKRFSASLDTRAHRATVARDISDARRAGIEHTPGTVLNRYFINGAQPLDVYQQAVEQALLDRQDTGSA